jgi:hypothetical protein
VRLWSALPHAHARSALQCGASPALYGMLFFLVISAPWQKLGSAACWFSIAISLGSFWHERAWENRRRGSLAKKVDNPLPDAAACNQARVLTSSVPQSSYIALVQAWTAASLVWFWTEGATPRSFLCWLMAWRVVRLFKQRGASGTAHAAHLGGALVGSAYAVARWSLSGQYGGVSIWQLSQGGSVPAALVALSAIAFGEERLRLLLPARCFPLVARTNMDGSLSDARKVRETTSQSRGGNGAIRRGMSRG